MLDFLATGSQIVVIFNVLQYVNKEKKLQIFILALLLTCS